MAERRTCDCCQRPIELVDENGLCFACGTFQTFATLIGEHTDLSGDETVDLAGELAEYILSKVINRLQVPGQENDLVIELLQTLERRERSH